MSKFLYFVPVWSLTMFFSDLEFNCTSGYFSQKQSLVPSFETSHLSSLAIHCIVLTVILWQWQEEKIFSFLSLSVMNLHLPLPKLSLQCSATQCSICSCFTTLTCSFYWEQIVLVRHLLLLEHFPHASMIKIKQKSLFCACQFGGVSNDVYPNSACAKLHRRRSENKFYLYYGCAAC